jgi:hypothetical protein
MPEVMRSGKIALKQANIDEIFMVYMVSDLLRKKKRWILDLPKNILKL